MKNTKTDGVVRHHQKYAAGEIAGSLGRLTVTTAGKDLPV
jgi:hypothetical protein